MNPGVNESNPRRAENCLAVRDLTHRVRLEPGFLGRDRHERAEYLERLRRGPGTED